VDYEGIFLNIVRTAYPFFNQNSFLYKNNGKAEKTREDLDKNNQQTQTMRQIKNLYKICKKSDTNFIVALLRLGFNYIIYNKKLLLHQEVKIKGIKNINANRLIQIGTDYVGFIHKTDKTFLNIHGKLVIKGTCSIGRGCRFDIGKNAIVSIGEGGYINCNTTVIIMHELTIGDNCVISWNCQFLDEDFHSITYPDKKETDNYIKIGNHVWIGCGVKIYKGTTIPNGCVVAADSIVKNKFEKENCLIGGNPAKILRENIDWK
jgi:acetyltransferase-like isoleucine patch superfamily enzyme